MAKAVAEKLLIKPNSTLWTSHADRLQPVEPLPEGVQLIERPDEAATGPGVGLRRSLAAGAAAYPKGNRADINRDTPWPILAEPGLRPIGQVAMAETWSALRPLKEGEPSRSSAADA